MKTWLLTLLLVISFSNAYAYGPIAVDTNGSPFIHEALSSTSPLTWNPETGALQDTSVKKEFTSSTVNGRYEQLLTYCSLSSAGNRDLRNNGAISRSIISNNSGVTLISEAWDVWANVATANLSFAQGSSLGTDVNVCNYFDYLDTPMFTLGNSDSSDVRVCAELGTCGGSPINPVVFDANGDIVAAEYGEANRSVLLGSAGIIIWDEVDGILKMQVLVNGVCLEDDPDTVACGSDTISLDDMKSILVHEFGHALGLSHSQVNINSVSFSSNGTAVLNSSASAVEADIVTMFPVLVRESASSSTNVDLSTLHKDDIAGISHLYPASGYSSSVCTVSGTVFRNDTGQRCAEVVLRDTTAGASKTNALSFITGSEKRNNGGLGASGCTETDRDRCGDFSITGLEVGKTYTIEVNAVDSSFTEGSRVDPCDPPLSFTGTAASSSVTVSCESAGESITGSDNANLLITLAAGSDDDDDGAGAASSGGCSLSAKSSQDAGAAFILLALVMLLAFRKRSWGI